MPWYLLIFQLSKKIQQALFFQFIIQKKSMLDIYIFNIFFCHLLLKSKKINLLVVLLIKQFNICKYENLLWKFVLLKFFIKMLQEIFLRFSII